MTVGEIISLTTTVWSIVKELINFYKHLEEKYGWGKNLTPEVKKDIQVKKMSEFDKNTVAVFEAKGLPVPDKNTQAYIREVVHEKVSGKPSSKLRKAGKTSGTTRSY